MDNRTFVGERLKDARLLRGKTLQELADLTGISKQSLSLYENKKNIPDLQRVFAIASALKVPYEFFVHEDGCKTKTEVTYFRSLSTATKTSRTAQSLKLEYVAKMYKALLEYVDFPMLNLPTFDFIGCDDENDENGMVQMEEEIEQIAAAVRQLWGIDDGPIENLQYLMEENGIIVTGFDVGEKIDAFSQRTITEYGDVFMVALEQGETPEGRFRFNICHELGHILMHPWSETMDSLSKEEFRMRERQANMFASAFLLQKETFAKDVALYPTDLSYYVVLKKKWKSSIQSMIMRSHQLKIITDNQYQYMMRQVSKKGWRTCEPGDHPYYLQENIFQGAIDLLLDENVLSVKGLMDLFDKYGVSLYPVEIEEYLHLRKDTLKDTSPAKSKIIQLKRKDD